MGLRLVMAVVLSSLSAGADEAPVSPETQQHIDAGAAAYDAGRYAEAVQELELAYQQSSRPSLLLDIARAQGKRGHDKSAISALRRYLEARPDAPDAAAVQAEIEAHEQALAERQAKKAKHAAEAAARAKAEAEVAQRRAVELARQGEQNRLVRQNAARVEMRRKAGMGLTIGGAALVLTGVALGVVAALASNQVSSSRGDFASCCADLESRGRASAGVGIAFDVVGGAAVAAGVGLWVRYR
jgi:tetratricopeptide (TPR) repeat protein